MSPEGTAFAEADPGVASSARIAALVWSDGRPADWLETLLCLDHVDGIGQIVFRGKALPKLAPSLGRSIARIDTNALDEALRTLFEDGFHAVLVVFEPVVLVPSILEHAAGWVYADRSIATVSFVSNAAGHLSFPYRNIPVPACLEGYDAESLTAKLRLGLPEVAPIPTAVPDGPAILVAHDAFCTLNGLAEKPGLPRIAALHDLGARAVLGGFMNALDPTGYVYRSWEWGAAAPSALLHEPTRAWLRSRHGNAFDDTYDRERTSLAVPVAKALDYARAQTGGLRILIDGSCLGPQEMGTHNLTLALAKNLAQHRDVREVIIAVPNPVALPGYVHSLSTQAGIRFTHSSDLQFPDVHHVDIIHRPYQPDGRIPWPRWRQLAKRSVITIQDLIAYRNGAYFPNYQDWQAYRVNLEAQCSNADAVVTISNDVVRAIEDECFAIRSHRIAVVPNGTDLTFRKVDSSRVPPSIAARHWADERLIVILGANYSHKNRDVGIRVWLELRKQGLDVKLVLAGANVPLGSTREHEAPLIIGNPHVLRLPDILGDDRDWLMANASLVIYPTSAEGFGFIPFEAASFGVPTLHVGFGPLLEMIDDPGLPGGWELPALVARATLLLEDRDAAKDAVHRVMQRNADLNWASNAQRHLDCYFAALRRPPTRNVNGHAG